MLERARTSRTLSSQLDGRCYVTLAGESVDALMGEEEGLGGSYVFLVGLNLVYSAEGDFSFLIKMGSDELLNDPRAVVLTIPPGVDPAEYAPRGRGRRGGCGGRSWRGGCRGSAWS